MKRCDDMEGGTITLLLCFNQVNRLNNSIKNKCFKNPSIPTVVSYSTGIIQFVRKTYDERSKKWRTRLKRITTNWETSSLGTWRPIVA